MGDRSSNLPGFRIENKGQIAIAQQFVSNSYYLSTMINQPSVIGNLRSTICDRQFAIDNLRSAICDRQ